VDVEVACDDEVVRSGCRDGQERLKLIKKSCEWLADSQPFTTFLDQWL
jgi:hypothetical protein